MDAPHFNPELRIPEHFLTPRPSLLSRARGRAHSLVTGPAVITYPIVRGIDVNQYHPSQIDWFAAKDGGILWAGVKATEHTSWVDPDFTAMWSGAVAAGVFVLPYHFFRCNYDPTLQVTHFWNTIQPLLDATGGLVLPPAADFETSDGQVLATRQSRAHSFLQQIEALWRQPAIYSSPYLWSSVMGNPAWGFDYLGWDAHWTSADVPTLPTGWDPAKRLFWQYGIDGTHWWVEDVPGTTDIVDADRFFGTVHRRFRTPHVSIVVFAALVWALAVAGSFQWNVTLSAVARLFTYGATCAARAFTSNNLTTVEGGTGRAQDRARGN